MTKKLKIEKNLPSELIKNQNKCSYRSKYGKIKINFFKSLKWMKYFEHKEAPE